MHVVIHELLEARPMETMKRTLVVDASWLEFGAGYVCLASRANLNSCTFGLTEDKAVHSLQPAIAAFETIPMEDRMEEATPSAQYRQHADRNVRLRPPNYALNPYCALNPQELRHAEPVRDPSDALNPYCARWAQLLK